MIGSGDLLLPFIATCSGYAGILLSSADKVCFRVQAATIRALPSAVFTLFVYEQSIEDPSRVRLDEWLPPSAWMGSEADELAIALLSSAFGQPASAQTGSG